MTRINTNVSSLVAQNRLNKNNSDLNTSLTRLSTGLRINTGKDDPAGLIASEALRSDITGINKAISNTQRANQIIATADSALGQVSSLLNDIRGLVVEAANSGALSDDEIAANQLQIDSSLEAINRIAQTTTFQGRKLLDGSLDFVSTIGSISNVTDAQIDQANLGSTGSVDVDVVISTAATQATLDASSAAFSTSAAANTATVVEGYNFTITGSAGGETLEIIGGSNFQNIEIVQDDALNGTATAAVTNGDTLTITIDLDSDPSTLDHVKDAVNALTGFSASSVTPDNADNLVLADLQASTATTADDIGFTVTALTNGDEYNNVALRYVAGAATGATYDETTKVLEVTLAAGNVAISDIETAIEGLQDGDSNQRFDVVRSGGLGVETHLAADFNGLVVDIASDALLETNTGTTGGEVLNDDVVFQLSGSAGADTFNFEAGASAAQIAAAVNLVSDATNVTASYTSGGALTFLSSDYGLDSLVDVDIISEGANGTFDANLTATRNNGTDISATVNGVTANGDANTFSINTATLDLSLTVTEGSNTNFSFTISGGGALFQLGGDVVSNQQARLGIGSLSTGKLGGATGRLYELGSGQARALATDVGGAGKIIDEVINKVTSVRGRLGAFQATTLESNLVALGETVANLTEAESSIRDADFAAESAALTRAQILVQSGTSVLGIANQNPQNVLALLR